jgi:hypothetical protein
MQKHQRGANLRRQKVEFSQFITGFVTPTEKWKTNKVEENFAGEKITKVNVKIEIELSELLRVKILDIKKEIIEVFHFLNFF